MKHLSRFIVVWTALLTILYLQGLKYSEFHWLLNAALNTVYYALVALIAAAIWISPQMQLFLGWVSALAVPIHILLATSADTSLQFRLAILHAAGFLVIAYSLLLDREIRKYRRSLATPKT